MLSIEPVDPVEVQVLVDNVTDSLSTTPDFVETEIAALRRRRQLDELLMDERFLAMHVAGKGIVVLTACSHAGVINVLLAAQAEFPDVPLYAVMGGLHLSGTNERVIPEAVQALQELKPAIIASGHCTGWRATSALADAFGISIMAPLAVGKRYML